MLAREHWVRVPEQTAGERSGLFAMEDALYGCYLRVGDPGPWAGSWAGIARLEMPSGIGRAAAVEAADQAAGWLPGFASALHRDARAPVNLTPIAGLEKYLHRRQGDARLALRAVREAVLEHNREGRNGMIAGGHAPGAAGVSGPPPRSPPSRGRLGASVVVDRCTADVARGRPRGAALGSTPAGCQPAGSDTRVQRRRPDRWPAAPVSLVAVALSPEHPAGAVGPGADLPAD